MSVDIRPYFPFSRVRPQQQRAIEFFVENYADKRFFILELPTGVGKSAIAYAITKWTAANGQNEPGVSKGAYIITTQKVLQEQYTNDFPEMANIWSKTNYRCQHRSGMNCHESMLLNKILKDSTEAQRCKESCVYMQAKRSFMSQNMSLTNVAYMLNQVDSPVSEVPVRQLLIVDECHNLEQAIVDHVGPVVYQGFCEKNLRITFPRNCGSLEEFAEWVLDVYVPAIEGRLASLEEDAMKSTHRPKNLSALLKEIQEMERVHQQIDRFAGKFDPSNWVMTVAEDNISVKPIYASNFTESSLFKIGKKVVMMSGTILDKETFCLNNGIPLDQACFISMGSPFPVENRKVFVSPAGPMSYKNIKQTLPRMVDMIKLIMEQHAGEKGIIHTNTYLIAKALKDADRSRRILVHDSKNRIEVLREHCSSSRDTVIVSPSFTEGVDLKDDFSRFQILCKVPFPYLGDNYVSTKMKRCKNWYPWMTVKTLVQALGRSVRNEKDHAVSYILDEDFIRFFRQNRFLFPEWFSESVEFL